MKIIISEDPPYFFDCDAPILHADQIMDKLGRTLWRVWCDHCGKHEESRDEVSHAYPNGWGRYEHYPAPGTVDQGDLCGECIAPILTPAPTEDAEVADEANLPSDTGPRDEG